MRAFVAIVALVILLAAGVSRGDEISDFRIPRHTAFSLAGDFSGWASPSSGHAGSIASSSGYVAGTVAASGWWLLDSDARRDLVALSTYARGNTSHQSTSAQGLLGDLEPYRHAQDSKRKDVEEFWRAEVELRRYPWAAPIGLGLRAYGFGDYLQHWNHETGDDERFQPFPQRVEFNRSDESWTYRYSAIAEASVGHGRVRDATAVYQVHLLEGRLMGDSVLTRPLSLAARERVAALYYVRKNYGAAHDRPGRFFWRDLERILKDDGALAEGRLDGDVAIHVEDRYAFVRDQNLSLTGHFVGFLATLNHEHAISRWDSRIESTLFLNDTLAAYNQFGAGDRRVDARDLVLVGGSAEFHRAIGWRWQGDVSGRLLFPTEHVAHGIVVASDARLGYWLADRWAASGFLSQDRSITGDRAPNGAQMGDSWSVAYGASLAFYVEDRTQLRFSAQESQTAFHRDDLLVPDTRQYSRRAEFVIGVSYHFLGGLDAPGLIEPVRQLPRATVPH